MITFDIERLDWEKVGGLIPAIIQDSTTGIVLMLGYMNKDALRKTLKTEKVTFFSRSRQALWVKGERSGHSLHLVTLSLDCDADTLLILANPDGPCCHTNQMSCFGDVSDGSWSVLPQLESRIASRVSSNASNSYTVELIQKGLSGITQKIDEESAEVVVAALQESDDRLLNELSDLFYHVLVLLSFKNILIHDVFDVLKSRMTLACTRKRIDGT